MGTGMCFAVWALLGTALAEGGARAVQVGSTYTGSWEFMDPGLVTPGHPRTTKWAGVEVSPGLEDGLGNLAFHRTPSTWPPPGGRRALLSWPVLEAIEGLEAEGWGREARVETPPRALVPLT